MSNGRQCSHAAMRGIALIAFVSMASQVYHYQVISASTNCPKIKKHAGIKLRPMIKNTKDAYSPGDMVIFSCESAEYTQTIKCLEGGKWTEIPHCPDPINFTCPDIGLIAHGTHNATNTIPSKVGTVVTIKCEHEFGDRLMRCLPSAKWSQPVPMCPPVAQAQQPLNYGWIAMSACLLLIPIILMIVIAQLFRKWRQKQQQRARWKQYFTDYKYRHSKTSITFGARPQIPEPTCPVTDL